MNNPPCFQVHISNVSKSLFPLFNIIHCSMVSSLLLLLLLTIFPSNVHPLHFNIINFSDVESASKNMAFEGDAKVVKGFIELNKDENYRTGRAVYRKPLHLWDSSTGVLTDFTTSFTFSIEVLEYNALGDGFAFHMAPISFTIPPNSGGGNFGLFNDSTYLAIPQNHIFLVEFDTNQNKDYDPLDLVQHVGINKIPSYPSIIPSLILKRTLGNKVML
ncbi:hypothetical protein PIB30_001029 [Stylosanthes scabra]|uniref:Legume lectin domain-containing protein n=1 Tax=Stylosanthes scabra TaxID=79078 RepID=A0ABU6T2D7_9FABA|nr:hypothetical protein [Stylosanthes scabra]